MVYLLGGVGVATLSTSASGLCAPIGQGDPLMMTWEVHFAFQKPLSAGSSKLLSMSYGRKSFLQEAERRQGELQKEMLLKFNTSVEKVSHAQAGSGV